MTASKIRMAMAAMADPNAKPKQIARELGVTTATLYECVNGDGSLKLPGSRVLAASTPDGTEGDFWSMLKWSSEIDKHAAETLFTSH